MDNNTYLSNDSIELSKMLHEIKNALTLIYCSLQLLESEHPKVKQFRFWEQTMDDMEGLRQLLNHLSSYEQCSVPCMEMTNTFDFAEDLLESMEAFLLETGTPVTFENQVSDLDFYGDSLRLRHAVMNLIKNAAESSPKGSPILLQMTADQNYLYIWVKDHGCGIKNEQLSQLFTPFYTTKVHGTGLGLPIVKRIVESHQGTLTVESEEGLGTCFCIRLPLR